MQLDRPILATNRYQTTVRAIVASDVRRILRLVETAWRVYLRPSPLEFRTKLKQWPGVLAEDRVGLRGFMAIEPQPPHIAFLAAAGVRDTWHIEPYLDLLLPRIEGIAKTLNLSKLVYVGNTAWLIDELWRRGYETVEWMVTLERSGVELPPAPPSAARLRPVTPADLHPVKKLDAATFDEIWHRAIGDLADALGQHNSFVLAELDGQIAGYVWCELYANRAHLARLAVQPHCQGRGIGAQLLHRAIVDALAQGIQQISLNTQEQNARSLALYRRFGFAVTNRRMPLLRKNLK